MIERSFGDNGHGIDLFAGSGETNDERAIWQRLVGVGSQHTLATVMNKVVGPLSTMTNLVFTVENSRVDRIPLSAVATEAGDPECEMVGVYLRMEDGLRGHALLVLPIANALHLVDALLDQRLGTSTTLGYTERSALAEVGNVLVAYFLNAVAEMVAADFPLRPSPPAVAVDMLGAILNTLVIPLAGIHDDLLAARATLADITGAIQARFWVLPDYIYQDLVE